MKTATKTLRLSNKLTAILGSLIVCTWTLIRFFNHGPNFDQVGQQVLAHQWLHGLHAGSVLGPTNYVLKMISIYMPLDFVTLSAQFKLIFMTAVINVGTFLLLAYILRLIWEELFMPAEDSLNFSLIYLALISGSVYWISYANSRNLEVVGGLFLMYLYIKAQETPTWRRYASLIMLGSLLFFADPLQIYMTLLPSALYIGLRAMLRREGQKTIILLKLAGCAILSILLARTLRMLVENIWNISFINTELSPKFSLSAVKEAISQTARLYSGGYEGGRLRQALDLLTAVITVGWSVVIVWRNTKVRRLIMLPAIVMLVDLAVYVFSGQAQQTDTNRYLIMTVPMFILILATVLYHLPRRTGLYVASVVLLVNIGTLGTGFAKAWDPNFNGNDHANAATAYMETHHYTYGYASINTALASDYLSRGKVNILPIGCDADFVLKKTNLFFDKAAFDPVLTSNSSALVPILLDDNSIRINSSVCGLKEIEKQLGAWQNVDYMSDGSTVLIYRANQLSKLRPVSQ